MFWGGVIRAGLIGVLFFAYQVKTPNEAAREYEGKVIDKWAGYHNSELGSFPYFRLLVENSGDQRSIVVDREIYGRVKVGMWITKTAKGIELSYIAALPPDVRKGLCPSVTAVLLVYRGMPPLGAQPQYS